MQRTYVLEKLSLNKLNSAKTKKQLQSIRKEAESNATFGITAKLRGRLKPELYTDDSQRKNYRYTVRLELAASSDRAEQAFDLVEKTIRKAAQLEKWNVVGEASTVAAQAKTQADNRPDFKVQELTPEVLTGDYFADIIDRDAHLRTIHAATQMFLRSKKKMRSHTILYGEPAACKTSMYEQLKEFYEQDDKIERVHMLDATTVSKAGLENWLLDKADAMELPEILCLEEVEKFDMNVLLPLGSIMDGRGVLTKLNARVNRSSKIYMLVWMTCNDESFVRNWHRGFLWSRCTHKLECVRPTREQMETLILPKKIADINGDPAWAKPACDFGYDVLKTDDPREIIALLDGAERLLTGEYQQDRLHILKTAIQAKERKGLLNRTIAGKDMLN
jgi:hypothetical protein